MIKEVIETKKKVDQAFMQQQMNTQNQNYSTGFFYPPYNGGRGFY
jgi:hypothetical protein